MEDCFVPKKQRPFFFTLIAASLLMLCAAVSHAQTTVDCSVAANCGNAYCNYAANVERGCRCFDGIDNDGDGKIDKADSNCATYYGLSFVGEGSNCSITPPGTADPFDLVNAPISSAQNTADTQSKVSVGDVDGDGIPDAVITSKWNSEIRVVATRAPQPDGTQAGAVKSDFNLSGNVANQMFSDVPNSGACKPSRLLFEHENLIADIDKDGKAELFGIVSNRDGNPETPPTCFYLVGFKYAPGDLVPLFKAVSVGTDRPGTFGIADMDGDGKAEIYMRDRIYAAETGKLLAQAGGDWDLDVTSAPVAVNISGDTKMELVCGTKIYSIPSLTDRNPASIGTLTLLHDMNATSTDKCYVKLMNDPVEYGEDTHSSCSVADIDKDGNVDVVISGALNSVTGKTAVFYWNVAKNQVNYFLPPDATNTNGWDWGTGRVNIGDANGDGKLDLSFISGNRLWCLKVDQTTGALSSLWASYRTINDSRSGVLTVTIYDFDNDGKPEMVYRDSQILAVIDGVTGSLPTALEWFANCQSHTYTEGPIIADVNGDGGTDICVACYTADNPIDVVKDGLQQQALGQFRLYYSAANDWLPTRKVWNQPGYFVVNIKDNLQLPFPQLDQNVIFGTGACPNGIPGPQMPMNVFLNQVPFLSSTGCPVFPAPDLSYIGDNPDNPGVDSNGDGTYAPAVEVVPPICGNLAIKVRFNIVNDGDLPISGNIPVSFFKADPTLATTTLADRLHTTTLNISNLGVDQTLTTAFETFNGTGGTFRLYIVLNNSGATLPINPNATSTTECRIDNNIYSVNITPDPFVTKIVKVQDNYKCANSGPNTGEVRVRIFKGGVEETDYSQYGFQWYTGPATAPVIINGATNYNLTGLPEGDYTALVRNVVKGCNGVLVDTTIVRTGVDPDVTIVATKQTLCNPPNGRLEATVAGGNTGYDFRWYDIGLNYLGIQGPVAANMVAGNYKLIVSKDGCTKQVDAPPIGAPDIPDAQAQVLQHVVDCLNPSSGSISADAIFNLATQNPANYTFDWYFYNNVTSTRGSILPPAYGSGQTRTGLPVGFYQIEITDNVTQCKANQFPVVEITSQTVVPTASISQVQPQTSCDPLLPNGILTASASGGTLVSPNDYTFEWFKGDNTLPANKVTTVSGVKGETVNQVSGGGVYYTVKVTTANNCSDTEKFIIAETIITPVVTLSSTPNSVCDPANATSPYNGTITATVSFNGSGVTLPNANYAFTWYQGATTGDPTIAVADNKLPTVAQLNNGAYTVMVERTDLHCKSLPDTEPVINAQVLPTITTSATGSTNCTGGTPNGRVTVTSVVPADTYQYRWFNPSGTVMGGAAANALMGLQGGAAENYTVEVTRTSTGCKNTLQTNVPDNKLIPVITPLGHTDNSNCAGATPNGTAFVDGTTPFTYRGTTITAPYTGFNLTWSGGTVDVSKSITRQLPAGNYTLTVTAGASNPVTNNNDNCISDPASVTIVNNQVLPDLSATPKHSTNCPGGNPNGEITVSINNSLAGETFAYEWHETALMTGAAISIANGGSTPKIINQQGGAGRNFIVQVTNIQTQCKNTYIQALGDVSQVPVISALGFTDNTNCAGATPNGTAFVDGTTPFTYRGVTINAPYTGFTLAWSGGVVDPTKDITRQLAAGTYNLIVTAGTNNPVTNNNDNCISSPAPVIIEDDQLLPALTATPKPSTNCAGGNPNGEVTVTVTNAVVGQTFTYGWHKGNAITDPSVPIADGGNTDKIVRQVGGNNYTVLVTINETQCKTTLTQTLADISTLPVFDLTVVDNQKCVAPFDGSLTITGFTDANADPADDYTVLWYDANNAAGAPALTLNNITPANLITSAAARTQRDNGFYTVTVTNERLNCKSNPVTREVLDNLTLPSITLTPQASTNCAGGTDNGAVSAVVTGLAGQTFSHAWFKGIDITGTPVGGNALSVTGQEGNQSYTLESTALQTGCKSTETTFVQDDSELPVITPLLFKDNEHCTIPDGTVNVAAVPFTYRGTVITNPYTGFTLSWSAGGALNGTGDGKTGLGPGIYTLQVTAGATNPVTNNNDNCISALASATIVDDLVFPDVAANVVFDQTSCDDVNFPNGQVTAVENSGSGTYSFDWYKGVGVTLGSELAEMPDGRTTTRVLVSDDYTVNVTNTTSQCATTQTIFLPDNIVPPNLFLTLNNNVTSCINPNGAIAVDQAMTTVASFADNDFTIYYLNQDPTSFTTDPLVIKASPSLTSSLAVNLAYPNLVPGDYSALIRDESTHCESQVVTIQVADNTAKANITIDAIVRETACNAGNDGGINISVAGGDPFPAAPFYNFAWYDGGPTNAPPFNFFNATKLPTFNPAAPFATTEDIGGETAGLYTVVVTDEVGCGTVLSIGIPFQDAPRFSADPTNSSQCDITNGDGALNIQLVGQSNYTVNIYNGLNPATAGAPFSTYPVGSNGVDDDGDGTADPADAADNDAGSFLCTDGVDNDGDLLIDSNDPDCDTGSALATNGLDDDGDGLIDGNDGDMDGAFPNKVNLNELGLNPGGYLVEVFDNVVGCGIFKTATIGVDALKPLVTLGTIVPNRACDTEFFASGTVEITVAKDPNDLTTAAPDYEIVDLTAPAPSPATNPAVWGGFNIPAATPTTLFQGIFAGTPADGGFGPQTYKIKIRENNSGCEVDQFVTIPDQPDIPQLIDVNAVNETYCAPDAGGNGTGQALVTAVNPIDIDDYTYTWFENSPTAGNEVYTAAGTAVPGGGQLFNATKYTVPANGWWNTTLGLGIGTRTYYVQGERLPGTGPGAGCKTPIVQVVIQDEHVTPVSTLLPFSNTSCLPGTGEGRIVVATTTNSTDAAVSSATYQYELKLGVASLTTLMAQNGTVPLLPANAQFSALLDNATPYTVVTTNETSGCTTQNNATILDTKFSLDITQHALNHKLICRPDGDIQVNEIIINRTLTGEANQTFAAATLDADFDFQWFRGTFNPATPLRDDAAFGNDVIATRLLTGNLVAANGEYATIGEGTYYVIGKRMGAGPAQNCETQPLRVEIEDQHKNPEITLTPFSNTACIGAFEGEIDVDVQDATDPSVNGGVFNFNYVWTAVTSTTTPGPLANPYVIAPATPDANFQQLEEGDYTLQVTNNQSGCPATATTTIFKNTIPIFVTQFDLTPQLYCDPSGKIVVTEITYKDRNGSVQVTDELDFIYQWSRNGAVVATTDPASPIDATHLGTELDSITYAGVGAGVYTLIATRFQNGPGAGCAAAPVNIEIEDEHVNPVVTLTPFSNTACNGPFEGEIEVDVTDASVAKIPPSPDAGVPFDYQYTWTPVSVAGGLPAGMAAPATFNGASNLFSNLQEGTYRLDVVNNMTGCTFFAQTSIIKNETPIFLQEVDPTAEFYCTPQGSGHLEVTSVSYNDRDGNPIAGNLAHFTYSWMRNTLATVVGNTVGSAPRGTFLDSLSYAGPAGTTIGAGTYYVVATRTTGTPGSGCSSAPFRVDIQDKRAYPTVSFSTIANTACDNNFDGRITVTSSTATEPGAGENYDIQWTALPAGNSIAPVFNDPSPYQTLLTDVIGPGSFTARVTNFETKCFTDATVSMISNPQPLQILATTPVDQTICYPEGSINVTTMSLEVPANYTFRWFRANATTPGTFDATTPLRDDAAFGSDVISTATLTGSRVPANGEYSAMGAGTYYVIATKNFDPNPASTSPGSGCSTPPYRQDIKDLHVDPVVSFTHQPNSSCDPVNPNGVVVATAREQNGSIVDTYSFSWTLNGGALPAVTVPSTTDNHTGRIDDAAEGAYVVTATNTSNTGCDITGSITVIKDLNISTPNIIDVATVDPVNCLPTASAEVTRISIGGITFYNTPPDNLDNTFDYEWYKGTFAPGTIMAGEVNHDLQNITPDKYYVMVKDLSTACMSTPKEVVINADDIIYPQVVITQTELQVSCVSTMGTAELQALADGQDDTNANYTFTWFGNLDTTPPSFQGGSTASNLTAGNYSVSVLNALTGCTAAQLYIVPDDAPKFMPELSLSTEPRVNCLVNDGALLAREVGWNPNSGYPFPPNYSTEIYTGANADVTQPGTPIPNVAGFNRNWRMAGLDVGTYTVKITDNNTGCVVTGQESVADGRTPPVVVVMQENPLTYCYQLQPNGQLSATADDGRVGGYTFDWYRGDAVAGAVLQQNNKLIGETAGIYTVRVTNDITACFADGAGEILDRTVKPHVPTAKVEQNRTHCLYPDGWVSASVEGVTFNYSFDWYDGATKGSTPDFNGINYTGRDIGPYTVTAMDVTTGCYSDPVTVEVADEKLYPELKFTTTPSFCEDVPTELNQGNGMIEMQLVPTYALSDSVIWTKADDNAFAASGSYVTGLYPGFYHAEVTTVKGCTVSGDAEVKTEILAYNLVTRNNDQKNDLFVIDCVSRFRNNNVKIFNRSGVLVYEANGYNNTDVVFQGLGEKGVYTTGNELPVGTYFYIIDKGDGSKPKTGYLELVK